MNNERYNQIIDEVYRNYADSHWIPSLDAKPKEEPTMITDWLNEYGDPEIYKKVERELELREAAAIGKFAEKKYLERLNNFQSIDFKDGVFEGAKWMRDKILNK